MPKYAANLSMLFGEVDFLDRFGAAAKAGFKGVEYLSPYEVPADRIAEELDRHGLSQVLFNLPSGDWTRGERGIACHPKRVSEFRDGVETASAYAGILGNTRINCLAGIVPPDVPRELAEETLIANLQYAAGRLAEAGILLLVEAINTFDIPGFLLSGSRQTIGILDRAGAANLRLQYDIYHMQRMEGEIAGTIERLLPRIAHIQIAGNPGRTEPDRGEIDYGYLIKRIDELGYDGWIGAEYKPTGMTTDGLRWLTQL
ncbi:MAG: 2-oxo-tetronate isomerase [Parvibaculaceae bacterium]